MGAESTKMQSTIFGAACIDKARALKFKKEKDLELWTENDIEFQLGLEDWEAAAGLPAAHPVRKRLFRAWLEDWEKTSSQINDVVHEAKLLHKYGGLRWHDPDNNRMSVAETDNLEWRRGLGWCVIGLSETGGLEPWPIRQLPSLIKKAKQLEEDNVEIVRLSKKELKERKAARLAAAEAARAENPKSAKKKGKRKRCESESESSISEDDDDDDYQED
jgi:hypothetical protein